MLHATSNSADTCRHKHFVLINQAFCNTKPQDSIQSDLQTMDLSGGHSPQRPVARGVQTGSGHVGVEADDRTVVSGLLLVEVCSFEDTGRVFGLAELPGREDEVRGVLGVAVPDCDDLVLHDVVQPLHRRPQHTTRREQKKCGDWK